jgi:hypothetical protein
MWKNMVEPDMTQMTVWCMHIACWITKVTDTLRMCTTYCFSLAIMVTQMRLSVMFVRTLPVLFIFSMLSITCEGKVRQLKSCLKGHKMHDLSCCEELYLDTWYVAVHTKVYLWTLWFDFEKLQTFCKCYSFWIAIPKAVEIILFAE